jgi:hypothetical protein
MHDPQTSACRPCSASLRTEEIDKIVVAQADDDSAWEEPIYVRRKKSVSLSIPAELAARVTFLARLHRQTSIDEWLGHIIQERVELEEAAFIRAKRELATRNSAMSGSRKVPRATSTTV